MSACGYYITHHSIPYGAVATRNALGSQHAATKVWGPHQQAGLTLDLKELSFRQTISGLRRSDRGFMVIVDRDAKKVVVSFDEKAVDVRHTDWLGSVQLRSGIGELDPQPYWGFDDLRHKAGTKLLNCFYVVAETRREEGQEFFRYSRILMMQKFSLEGLLQGIEQGFVYVDFDARSGHNHGTKFRLRQNMLPSLYETIVEIE